MPYDTTTTVTDDVNDNLASYHNQLKTAIDHLMSAAPYAGYANVQSMTGNVTLTDADYPVQSFSPTAARDLTFPAVASTNHVFYAVNRSSSYDITCKNSGGTVIGIVAPGMSALYFSDGSNGWYEARGTVGNQEFIERSAAPATPGANKWRAYFKSDGMYVVDDAGAETGPFGTGGGGGSGHPMNGRLTLETGVPISTSAQTAKTTLYLTAYQGNQVAVYTGTEWTTIALTGDLSITLASLTASLPYDVFVYSNSGVLTLELTAWTNGTTRATALTTQDLILVKTGATTRRYIGTICITSTTGQCEDSYSRRFVYNYYNQVPRQLARIYVSSHNYTTAAWRYWNNSQTNSQVEIILGVAQNCMGVYRANITSLAGGGVSFGVDSSSPGGSGKGEQFNNAGDAASSDEWNFGIGYHYWVGVEYGNAGGMTAERISMTMTAMM